MPESGLRGSGHCKWRVILLAIRFYDIKAQAKLQSTSLKTGGWRGLAKLVE